MPKRLGVSGFALGLSLARRIMRLHKGSIGKTGAPVSSSCLYSTSSLNYWSINDHSKKSPATAGLFEITPFLNF